MTKWRVCAWEYIKLFTGHERYVLSWLSPLGRNVGVTAIISLIVSRHETSVAVVRNSAYHKKGYSMSKCLHNAKGDVSFKDPFLINPSGFVQRGGSDQPQAGAIVHGSYRSIFL